MNEQWISLEQASEITGASQAIILDTINKYQGEKDTVSSKIENGVVYYNKSQLVSLFPGSANPFAKEKIPGTVFRWFDELRRAYEISMTTMFKRVEKVKDDHKEDLEKHYEIRINALEQHYSSHLLAINSGHQAELKALNHHINKLEHDTIFYQNQVIAQQETLSQLNNRYDAVILALRNKNNDAQLAETFSKDITPIPAELEANKPAVLNEERPAVDVNLLVKNAYQYREQGNFSEAVKTFEQAALLGHAQAMGALGRSYFVGEGTELNKELAIAWLHLAAENGFEPAHKKLSVLAEKLPEDYQHGLALAKPFALQIKLNRDQQI